MRRIMFAFLVVGTMACGEITVPLPDFGGPGPGTDDGSPDVHDLDPGQVDGADDPGNVDPGPLDPGQQDPGTEDQGIEDSLADTNDPGEPDVFKDPQNGSYPCRDPVECLSGECHRGLCTCNDVLQCDPGLWCDAGDTAHYSLALCLPPRPLFAGCTNHVQCESGACDRMGYCAMCAQELDMCGPEADCCAGECAQGCLGCGVSPDMPVMTRCLSGCYDPDTQFCGPGGAEFKREFDMDCQFNNSWCESGRCVPSADGLESHCEPLIMAAIRWIR